MYHYIFFDLDGTLTDSKEGILNSLRYAFQKMGRPVPSEETLLKFIGPPLQDSFVEYCAIRRRKPFGVLSCFGSGMCPSENSKTPLHRGCRSCAPG